MFKICISILTTKKRDSYSSVKEKKYFVLLEGPRQILLGATRPPYFCICFLLYSFCSLFICCYSCAFFKIKNCKNDTYIKKGRKPTARHIVCPVQNTPRIHSYHVDLFSFEMPSFVRGLNNPHIGLRPYLEKLKIRVETRYTREDCTFRFSVNFSLNFKKEIFISL